MIAIKSLLVLLQFMVIYNRKDGVRIMKMLLMMMAIMIKNIIVILMMTMMLTYVDCL